jgi:hypothetical protein
LIYDFRQNEFQLHIHCQKHAQKAKAVRVKRYAYGDAPGEKADGAWGLVEHFMKKYPPNWKEEFKKCQPAN